MAEQMDGIETTARRRIARLEDLKHQITDAPIWSIGTLAAVSALIGVGIGILPWVTVYWIETDLHSKADRLSEIRSELATEEARLAAMRQVRIETLGDQKVLLLPTSTDQIWFCKAAEIPCIKLED